MDSKYNGWSNYSTWCVKLWMDNEQGSSEAVQEMAAEAWKDTDEDDSTEDRTDAAVRSLADQLEAMHDDAQSELVGVTGVMSDLLTHALGLVDWHEIATSYIEDAIEAAT